MLEFEYFLSRVPQSDLECDIQRLKVNSQFNELSPDTNQIKF